jgi:hypothetical protein
MTLANMRANGVRSLGGDVRALPPRGAEAGVSDLKKNQAGVTRACGAVMPDPVDLP